MKAHRSRYSFTLSLTSALLGSVWSTPGSDHFTPGKRPGTYFTEGRVGPRADLKGVENLSPHRDQIRDHSSHKESIYRLNYPGWL